ncbi:hypothetical protein FVA81_01460 (plasmid) [Rhizobium sp. WL3]|uniref:hypothetical protein n=1 Tax=Rhizobium sp. WL3 TaxID=2603277 RepID=UPI0011C1F68E|nr:hypothetical protein [Rhizobium sp. WL3]QEE43342.1 hypothetical protein FVA81_01460 [Rhizobium sp. WL3]
MKKYFKSQPVEAARGNPSDQALLDIIESNVQRLPGNDNSLSERQERPAPGLMGSVTSALAFAGLSLLGVVVMAIFRLVPSSEDSHY